MSVKAFSVNLKRGFLPKIVAFDSMDSQDTIVRDRQSLVDFVTMGTARLKSLSEVLVFQSESKMIEETTMIE